MRPARKWQIYLGIVLLALSTLLYGMHYLIFRDSHHIFLYLLGDIAFVPIEVLLVTLIIHRLLSEKENNMMLEKMNMVIGSFFSEAGMGLIKDFLGFCRERPNLSKNFLITQEWSDSDFHNAIKFAKSFDPGLDSRLSDLAGLRDFLSGKRDFMVRLLEHPMLLEHEPFSDLLWAVFHLTEELEARGEGIGSLPDSDCEHITGDMNRVYCRLISEWLAYLRHLKKAYPFLYSLYVRTNPLNPDASPVVKGS